MDQRWRNLVVPVDDTEGSDFALLWTIKNIVRPGDHLHLVHVIPEPDTSRPWPGLYIPIDEDKIEEEEVPFDVVLIVGPDNADAIAKIISVKAQELLGDVVLVARHSKTRLQEFWMGSVTQRLVHQCPVPVVVIP